MKSKFPQLVSRLQSGDFPHAVGIAGGVAVGKSSFAQALAQEVQEQLGYSVWVVSLDAFLFPHQVLKERGLLLKKGFPESFDQVQLLDFLDCYKAGEPSLNIPVYSHQAYDILPGERQPTPPCDVIILEGLIAIQPAVREKLDTLIYLDADEAHMKQWYEQRFLGLCALAKDNPKLHHHQFVHFSVLEQQAVADKYWRTINLKNLHTHITPYKLTADIILKKNQDHTLL